MTEADFLILLCCVGMALFQNPVGFCFSSPDGDFQRLHVASLPTTVISSTMDYMGL